MAITSTMSRVVACPTCVCTSDFSTCACSAEVKDYSVVVRNIITLEM